MNSMLRVVASFAAGAAFMYYLDPVAGRRRRSLVRDQAVSVRHDAERYARAKSKRAADHVQGALAKTRARIAPRPVDDEQLRERIRAKLGHVIDRPSALEVEVHGGHVVLSGDLLNTQIGTAVETVATMHGVRGIVTHLSPSPSAPSPSASAGASASTHQAQTRDMQDDQPRREVQH
jgi:hyperosmotically inducible periplasmic protein